MEKKQIIILTLILSFLVIISCLLFLAELGEKQIKPPATQQPEEERFGLTGWILDVDQENNSFTIKSERDGKIFKIFVDNKTSLLKIELLPQKLPTGVTKKLLDVVQTETALANLQKEDYVSLFSSENIVGKKQVKASIRICPLSQLIQY